MARSNLVALPGPNDPYWDAVGDELERKEMRQHRPWRLDGITVYEWLAARPDLVRLDVPPAAEEYAIYGMAEPPPNTDAVYFLMSDCGEVLYVGKSTELARRLDAHLKANAVPFWGARWRLVPSDATEVLEAYLIHKMQPPYNAQFRNHDWCQQVCEALEETTRF